jgi:hypothetical protein
VAVGVQRERDGGVTQLLANRLRVDTLGQQDRRDRVPRIVQANLRQPGALGLADKLARQRLWVERPTSSAAATRPESVESAPEPSPLGNLMQNRPTSLAPPVLSRHAAASTVSRVRPELRHTQAGSPAVGHEAGMRARGVALAGSTT